ncbi:MAG: response regulator [Proteobacteria bacterium]|nr:response regulator [Pseudomonadota bacterium]
MAKNILIVEDSAAMRSMIDSILGETVGEEFLITEAQNGFEALKLLPRIQFDLILTDINMPDINGLELLTFLKSNPRYRDIPTLVITTEGKEEDRRRGLALGADEYLIKPFTPESLIASIKRLLGKTGPKG